MKKFLQPDIETGLMDNGADIVIGIDEVGRGPWAGPMYLCAYIWSNETEVLEGVTDSKKISIKKREILYGELKKHDYVFEIINVKEIDKESLGVAINNGLKKLIEKCIKQNEGKNIKFQIDGYFKGDWENNVEFISKGDSKVYSIACASILAKVERDHVMYKLADKYPEYGFESHVGYGTKKHKESIEEFGVIEGVHRVSFKPVKKLSK